MPTPESIVKGEIRDYLRMTGEMFLRLNSGKIRSGKRWIMLCEPGTPDFQVIREIPVWIEVKAEGGRTDPERAEKQAAFAKRVKALGHRHLQATTLEQVIQFLDGRQ